MFKILHSAQDSSVNFTEDQTIGSIETRYVRKTSDYFICYLSSQTGCNRGCKFCHLTTTKQTQLIDIDIIDYAKQAIQIIDYYKTQSKAKYIHYNFMARGEPLSNSHLLENGTNILSMLGNLASVEKLSSKFNISTIFPRDLSINLNEIFPYIHPTIYYSLYSTNDTFRKNWLPNAMNVSKALELLKNYQDISKKIVKIHFAFIENENDRMQDMINMCDMIDYFQLMCEFNLVRYNPFSVIQGTESNESVIETNIEYLKTRFKGKVKIIPRVGFDVKASCGMFIDKAN